MWDQLNKFDGEGSYWAETGRLSTGSVIVDVTVQSESDLSAAKN